MNNAKSDPSIENIYTLDGRIPLGKAIPFGLQHVLAMFVSNVVPIVIVAASGKLDQTTTTAILQNCMFIAGIATLIQLFPIWKIGSGLPVVMGISFTFVAILSYISATYGYVYVMGAVLIGGLIEGSLGLLAKYKGEKCVNQPACKKIIPSRVNWDLIKDISSAWRLPNSTEVLMSSDTKRFYNLTSELLLLENLGLSEPLIKESKKREIQKKLHRKKIEFKTRKIKIPK